MRHLSLFMAAASLVACATAPVKPMSPITFGLTKPISEQTAKSNADDLAAYLTQKLGVSVTTKAYDNADQLAAALDQGSIDAAWMTPGAYVRATAAESGIRPLLKISRGGVSSYRSAFFTMARVREGLASYKGKRLALVAKGSMSGRLYPLAFLKKLGLDPKTFFGAIIDAKDHKEVCEMVFDGRADLGATFSDDRGTIIATADGCREAGFDPSAFAVVAVSGVVPNDVIAVRSGMSEETADRLKQTLMEMQTDATGQSKLKDIFHADGFAAASDGDFKDLRELQQYVTAD